MVQKDRPSLYFLLPVHLSVHIFYYVGKSNVSRYVTLIMVWCIYSGGVSGKKGKKKNVCSVCGFRSGICPLTPFPLKHGLKIKRKSLLDGYKQGAIWCSWCWRRYYVLGKKQGRLKLVSSFLFLSLSYSRLFQKKTKKRIWFFF